MFQKRDDLFEIIEQLDLLQIVIYEDKDCLVIKQKSPTIVELILSGWRDSNPRPPAPHAGAIPGYATTRNRKANLKKIFYIHEPNFDIIPLHKNYVVLKDYDENLLRKVL